MSSRLNHKHSHLHSQHPFDLSSILHVCPKPTFLLQSRISLPLKPISCHWIHCKHGIKCTDDGWSFHQNSELREDRPQFRCLLYDPTPAIHRLSSCLDVEGGSLCSLWCMCEGKRSPSCVLHSSCHFCRVHPSLQNESGWTNLGLHVSVTVNYEWTSKWLFFLLIITHLLFYCTSYLGIEINFGEVWICWSKYSDLCRAENWLPAPYRASALYFGPSYDSKKVTVSCIQIISKWMFCLHLIHRTQRTWGKDAKDSTSADWE